MVLLRRSRDRQVIQHRFQSKMQSVALFCQNNHRIRHKSLFRHLLYEDGTFNQYVIERARTEPEQTEGSVTYLRMGDANTEHKWSLSIHNCRPGTDWSCLARLICDAISFGSTFIVIPRFILPSSAWRLPFSPDFIHLRKKSTSVLLSRNVCSYIKTNGLFQRQSGTAE